MKLLTYRPLLAALILSIASLGQAQTDDFVNSDAWKLRHQEAGVEVRIRSVPDSDVDAFQGKAVLNASMASLLAVLTDPDTCPRWVEGCVHAENLGPATLLDSWQYGVNDLPWPADDRDYIIHIQLHQVNADEVLLTMNAVPDKTPQTDKVRVPKMKVAYSMRKVSEQQTEVTWSQHTDPGGRLPGWMVNLLLVDIPLKSLKRMEALAQQPQYQQRQLERDEKGQILGWMAMR